MKHVWRGRRLLGRAYTPSAGGEASVHHPLLCQEWDGDAKWVPPDARFGCTADRSKLDLSLPRAGSFNANGNFVLPNNSTGPKFPLLTWVKVDVSYELPDSTHVRLNYFLNGQFYQTLTLVSSRLLRKPTRVAVSDAR